MKRVITLLLLLTVCVGATLAQKAKDYEYVGLNNFPLDTETGAVTYEGIVEAKGKSAQDLYDGALLWVTKNHKDGVKDQQPGESISGRGTVRTTPTTVTKYDFLLQFKDGRYRYVLNNFVVLWTSGSTALEEYYPSKMKNRRTATMYDREMQEMNALFEAEAAKVATIGAKKENW